jgi:hypothetical protein
MHPQYNYNFFEMKKRILENMTSWPLDQIGEEFGGAGGPLSAGFPHTLMWVSLLPSSQLGHPSIFQRDWRENHRLMAGERVGQPYGDLQPVPCQTSPHCPGLHKVSELSHTPSQLFQYWVTI